MAKFSGKRKEEEWDKSNGNTSNGKLTSVKMERTRMNKLKVVEGHVEKEQLWKLQRCLGMSAEAFDVEDNSFCNVMSVPVAREVIVDISD
ncbi:hypothetical protein Godav_012945 [Gossypium davidsonii]|uniref:Uncharacterized protein n=1 Tax=Gossypium davidsonii TaxID=34287 RepID=A0A7J8RES1_GOSDV|nr:hypothetical protein [Gossypium davidsonii]